MSAAAVITVGLGVLLIYEATGSVSIGDGSSISSATPLEPSGGETVKTSSLIWGGLFVAIALAGLMFVMKRLNNFVRDTIDRLASFLNWPIFATEMVLTLAIWGLCTILLLWWLPVGAFLSGAGLIFTEICFILAWLLYKRPKYKL